MDTLYDASFMIVLLIGGCALLAGIYPGFSVEQWEVVVYKILGIAMSTLGCISASVFTEISKE